MSDVVENMAPAEEKTVVNMPLPQVATITPEPAAMVEVPSYATMPLPAILHSMGELNAITPEDEAELLNLSPSAQIEFILEKKLAGEVTVLKAIALQLELPIISSIEIKDIPDELVAGLPINFCKKHKLLPLSKQNGAIEVAISDPYALGAIDELSDHFGLPCALKLARSETIINAINGVYDRRSAQAEATMEAIQNDDDLNSFAHELEETKDLLDSEDEAPIIRLVNSLISQAIKEHASDIHVEPMERDLIIRFRIDGILHEKIRPPKKIQSSMISRIKIMAGLNIAEKRLPQDGRIRIKMAGKDIDIRTATVPTSHGERITMRLLDRSSILLDLTDLGFSPENYKKMDHLIHSPHGIILVTGPTGSGKTTTLYACLSKINTPDRNILTVEDPVEYQLQGISQVQVNPKIELTFASGLRSFLRHDPDVIMVGEIRDLETAEIAIQASLTGHLVLSTIHTNDSSGAIMRLVDMGVEPFLVASSLIGILAQRLVRTICPHCKKAYQASGRELDELGIDSSSSTLLYKGEGCEACGYSGYHGRAGIYELLTIDDDIRRLVMANSDASTVKRTATGKGMLTLREDGAHKVLAGITTTSEVLRVTHEDEF